MVEWYSLVKDESGYKQIQSKELVKTESWSGSDIQKQWTNHNWTGALNAVQRKFYFYLNGNWEAFKLWQEEIKQSAQVLMNN